MNEYIVSALIGFLGIVIGLFFGMRKSNAEADNLSSETQERLQNQLLKWSDRWDVKQASEEKERIDKRKETDAIYERIRSQDKKIAEQDGKMLSLEMLNASMTTQIVELKIEKEKADRENIELRKLVQEHGGQIDRLTKKVTGQLPPL